VVRTTELENPDYAAIRPTVLLLQTDLFTHLQRLAAKVGADCILYARTPTMWAISARAQAAREQGARAPLQEAGLTKEEVRQLARRWGIPVWNRRPRPVWPPVSPMAPRSPPKPSASGQRKATCGDAASPSCGATHDHLARIELPAADLVRLLQDQGCERIRQAFTTWGTGISPGPARFRSGSMNETLIRTHPGRGAPPESRRTHRRPGAGHALTRYDRLLHLR